MLDLPEVARRLLAARRRRRGRVERPVHQLRAELFFSHRRDAGRTGRQAGSGVARWLSRSATSTPRSCARNLERVRERCGPEVEILAATKYVARSRSWRRLAEAGVELVGENRLQDLEAKRERFGDRFTWDFIGNLQSRKVKPDRAAGAADPLGRHRLGARAARAPRRPGDRGAGRGQRLRRDGEGRGRAGGARRVHRPLPGAGRRADDDAAVHDRPGGLAAVLRAARRARRRARARAPLDGHEPGLGGRGRRGRDDRSASEPRSIARSGRFMLHNPGKGITGRRTRTPAAVWHSETHGTARSSTSASPRTRTTASTTSTSPTRSRTARSTRAAPRRARRP